MAAKKKSVRKKVTKKTKPSKSAKPGVAKKTKAKKTVKKVARKKVVKTAKKAKAKSTVKKARVVKKKSVKQIPDNTKKVVKKTTKKKAKKVVKEERKLKPGVEMIKINGEDVEYIPPKSFKMLGFCPKCHGMIGSNDLVSKMIFVCPYCQTRKRTKFLKESSKKGDKVKASNKEEYLKAARNIKVELEPIPVVEKEEVKEEVVAEKTEILNDVKDLQDPDAKDD